MLLALVLGGGCGGAPEVPHTIVGVEDASCVACHAPGPAGSAAAPHSERAGCVSCHLVPDDALGADLLPGP